jgi:hypothetical protein
MAFTAEDKIRYAGMFGDDSDDDGAAAAEEALLASDVSEDENFADVSRLGRPTCTRSDDHGWRQLDTDEEHKSNVYRAPNAGPLRG